VIPYQHYEPRLLHSSVGTLLPPTGGATQRTAVVLVMSVAQTVPLLLSGVFFEGHPHLLPGAPIPLPSSGLFISHKGHNSCGPNRATRRASEALEERTVN
jgi:hypothetical protein